mgnify:CR=1 FL=1
MFLSNAELLAAIVALTAGYLVYKNVMDRNGSRKAAFWWAFCAAMLPVVFVPVYLLYRGYLYFKHKDNL